MCSGTDVYVNGGENEMENCAKLFNRIHIKISLRESLRAWASVNIYDLKL